jgi:spore germination protein KB
MPPLEQGKISATQLIFLLLDQIIPATLIFTVGVEVRQDAWLAILPGVAASLGFTLLYLTLGRRFQGQTLIGINQAVWGPYFGWPFSILYLLFYLSATFLCLYLAVAFQKAFLPHTPPLVLAFLGAGLSLLLSACGLEVLARCSQIIRIFTTAIWGILLLLIIPEIKTENFLPVFQIPVPLLLKAALRVGAFSFGTGFAYLMIFPMVRQQPKTFAATFKAFGIGTGYLMTGIYFAVGTLGPAAVFFTFPSLTVSRLINIGEIFTRMELVTGVLIWLGIFFLQSIYVYNLTMGVGELFRLKSATTLGLPFWILLSLLSVHSFANNMDNWEFSHQVYPWLVIPFQYLIPLLTLLVAVIRRLPRKKA